MLGVSLLLNDTAVRGGGGGGGGGDPLNYGGYKKSAIKGLILGGLGGSPPPVRYPCFKMLSVDILQRHAVGAGPPPFLITPKQPSQTYQAGGGCVSFSP